MLGALDPERDLSPCLPPLIDACKPAGSVNSSAAAALGLQEGIPVSSGGGDQPRWRADSGELFFRTADRAIASVTIEERGGRVEPGRETIVIQESDDLSDFDVTPDGSRFLLVRANEGSVRPVSHVITRWERLLEK